MVNFRRAWNVILRGKCSLGHFYVKTARGAMLPFAWQAQDAARRCRHDTLRPTLHTFHSHIAHVQFHSTFYIQHFTTLHRLYTPQTLHSTLYPPRSTLHNSHSLRSTLLTSHFPFHTLRSGIHAPHFRPHTPQSTVHSALHTTLHNSHSTLYTPQLHIPNV